MHLSKILFTVLWMSSITSLIAQDSAEDVARLDSMVQLLSTENNDSILIRTYTRVGHYYQDRSKSQAIGYYQSALELAKKSNNSLIIGNSYYNIALSAQIKGDLDMALDHFLQAARKYEEIDDQRRLMNAMLAIASIYGELKNFEKTNEYHDKAQDLAIIRKDSVQLADLLNSRGVLADKMNNVDIALDYFDEALSIAEIIKEDGLRANILSNRGLAYKHSGKPQQALDNFNQTLQIFDQINAPVYHYSMVYNNIASANIELGNYEIAKLQFDKSIDFATEIGARNIVMENYRGLSKMYGKTNDYKSQVDYLTKYHSIKDSLFSADNQSKIIQLESDYQIDQKNLEILKNEGVIRSQKNQRNILFVILLAALSLLLLLGLFYSKIRNKNTLLHEKNDLINKQKSTLQTTLSNLKATQAQLIQSEKMASLGELTAGIAHEIQNPLNFVNNFSEVNTELIDEMVEEINEGNYDEVKELANDIKSNEEKIKHHGSRADSIVKGMLKHSRTNSGEKTPTDINAICDEYLRLAYHGMRAKDNTFNAKLETDFADSIGTINVVAQDIRRVILNLFTNAFQATSAEALAQEGCDYHPEVAVKTKLNNNWIEIHVIDNGSGIPDAIKDKIFQPFFTTKDTGQGTGLGLSLAYDIVKAHGGELQVESQEGVGTTFIVTLPNN